jgi:hypothetical protein
MRRLADGHMEDWRDGTAKADVKAARAWLDRKVSP